MDKLLLKPKGKFDVLNHTLNQLSFPTNQQHFAWLHIVFQKYNYIDPIIYDVKRKLTHFGKWSLTYL